MLIDGEKREEKDGRREEGKRGGAVVGREEERGKEGGGREAGRKNSADLGKRKERVERDKEVNFFFFKKKK